MSGKLMVGDVMVNGREELSTLDETVPPETLNLYSEPVLMMNY